MANNVAILDGAEASKTFKTTDTAGVHVAHVNVDTNALPTGAATAANQDTANTALAAIQTAVQLIDNAVSGSEFQVDVVASLPAGTNNIGDVDVLSIIPGTGATNLGKAEDAAHASGDTGVMMLAVRKDTAAASSGTSGDYEPLQTTATGALRVADVDSVPLSSLVSGVLTNTDGASTAVIAAQGSGVITYLTDITITNSSASAVMVEIKDGTTAKWRANIPAGLGITHRFSSPLVGTANTAWNLDAASATSTLYASFSGFKV
jgi:hypothetical protein